MNVGFVSIGRRGFLSTLGRVFTAAGLGLWHPWLSASQTSTASPRKRTLIDEDWRFTMGDPPNSTDSLSYDVVKSWVLPTGNAFLKDPAKQTRRPDGNVGDSVAYVATIFDDSSWRKIDLPHDYAIEGPFTTTGGGGMGRLPSAGVVWYRKNLNIPASGAGKSIFLDIDGAMSYGAVWLNGRCVGGWPYGYASFRLNLTPYAKPCGDNVLAIRLDNPPSSSRWYPGGGLYRNIWLVETAPVHVGQWGTYITTPDVSATAASVNLRVILDNDSTKDAHVTIETQIFELDGSDRRVGSAVSSMAPVNLLIAAGAKSTMCLPRPHRCHRVELSGCRSLSRVATGAVPGVP